MTRPAVVPPVDHAADHAVLAARIMRRWTATHFPDSPRKASILAAIEHHDDGWASIDEDLVVDEEAGRLLDYTEVSDVLKWESSLGGITALAADPWARALVAQHRLHVYRRFAGRESWKELFKRVAVERDAAVAASAGGTLEDLLEEYVLLRAGDLASLVFCDELEPIWPSECGYSMRLEGTTLVIAPDPFGGASFEIAIGAREIATRCFTSAKEARRVAASAPRIELTGRIRGAA